MFALQHRRFVITAVLCGVCLLVATGVFGQEGKASEWVPDPSRPAGAEKVVGEDVKSVSLLGVLGKLALVAIGIYGVAWGVRFWQDRDTGAGKTGTGGLIHVRESVSLGTGGRLYVVKFCSQNLLVAYVGERVTVLADDTRIESTQASLQAGGKNEGDNDNGKHPFLKSEGPGQTHSRAEWAKKRDLLIQNLQESSYS